MRKFRILVVEPDDTDRGRLQDVLEAVGEDLDAKIETVDARDGTTAMALCGEQSFDLLVAEALLQGVSGLALLRALSTKRDPPRVILVTSMARETDRYWGLRNGALAYFTKPFVAPTLRDRIKRALTEPSPKSDRPAKI